jgi:two-component system sensor histidine kinase VicK
LECDKKEVGVSVHDTGLGIPADQQERIFTKFFRATNAMRVDTEGSGLGLFISKNIIDAHGGRIWFKSEEGKGTTLSFALPCAPSGEGLV